jgi:hypothetical protein
MNRKLLLLILIIPNIFYCQSVFKVSDLKNLNSKVISLLNEKNIFPSDVKSSEIKITDLIDAENLIEDNNTNGIYSIYYHYHWNSYLLFKNKNEFILYAKPLENTDLVFSQIIGYDKTKKESKKYLKQIYNHLYYLIDSKYNSRHKFTLTSNDKDFEQNTKAHKTKNKNKLNSERKKLKKEYKYYLNLISKR